MNITDKLFSPKENDTMEKGQQEVMDAIYSLLERTVDRVVRAHWRNLIRLSPDEIVSAIWGSNGDRPLMIRQETIYREIAPALQKAFDFLNRGNLDKAQQLAVHYLICGMMAYKMIFMTMVVKNGMGIEALDEKNAPNFLLDMNVAGHA